MTTFPNCELVPTKIVAAELHVHRRTIGYWLRKPPTGFPAPVEINKRLYFNRAELEAWKTSRAVASVRGGAVIYDRHQGRPLHSG